MQKMCTVPLSVIQGGSASGDKAMAFKAQNSPLESSRYRL